jgi:magnesium transporter
VKERMRSIAHRESRKTGMSPGSLVYTGDKVAESIKMTVFEYREGFFRETTVGTPAEADPAGKSSVTWLNVDGISDPELIEAAGQFFGLHPLLLEDILNTGQRPKCDDYGDYLFLVLKMLRVTPQGGEISLEQVSLVLGDNYLISFQEDIGDVFDPVRERLRSGKGKIRKAGPDYLAYALIDAIVDNYFLALEKLDNRLEAVEEQLMTHPTVHTLNRIHRLKRELLFLRRAVWPLREAVSVLERSESGLVKESTELFLRDLYDHTVRIIETIETFQEMLAGLLDIYLSSVSNKMNEIMKVLTIISTIFMPLSFIAGVYGMNFKNMPELRCPWGYYATLAVMGLLVLGMLYYFKRKKWL